MPFMSGVVYALLNAYVAFATSVRRLLLVLVDLPLKDALTKLTGSTVHIHAEYSLLRAFCFSN